MISLATSDEVEQVNKRIDALEEYLQVREIHVITTVGMGIKIIPDETNQTPPSK